MLGDTDKVEVRCAMGVRVFLHEGVCKSAPSWAARPPAPLTSNHEKGSEEMPGKSINQNALSINAFQQKLLQLSNFPWLWEA